MSLFHTHAQADTFTKLTTALPGLLARSMGVPVGEAAQGLRHAYDTMRSVVAQSFDAVGSELGQMLALPNAFELFAADWVLDEVGWHFDAQALLSGMDATSFCGGSPSNEMCCNTIRASKPTCWSTTLGLTLTRTRPSQTRLWSSSCRL